MLITLGNTAPITSAVGLTVGAPSDITMLDPLVNHTTEVVVDESLLADPTNLVTQVVHAWKAHSAAEPGWLAAEGIGPDVDEALRAGLGMPRALGDDVARMLLTNAGHDFVAKQLAGAASATAVAKFIALTADSTTPDVSDTTLTGEIATASGGLVRAAGTYAHTGGTSTYTVSNTFTANANDSLPVTIAKVGKFDAASAGNMVFETLLSPTAILSASGDTLSVTWTITA